MQPASRSPCLSSLLDVTLVSHFENNPGQLRLCNISIKLHRESFRSEIRSPTMELAIPAPAEVKYIRHPDCFCCIGHHLSDSHVHNNTIVVFDSPLNPSPGIGFAAIKLAREYTRKPSISLLAANGTSHVDCTGDCVNSEVKPKGPPPSPKKRDIDSR